jgi:hypothetical protein
MPTYLMYLGPEDVPWDGNRLYRPRVGQLNLVLLYLHGVTEYILGECYRVYVESTVSLCDKKYNGLSKYSYKTCPHEDCS